MIVRPGMMSTTLVMGDPQSGQKLRWTGFPLSPVSSKVFICPVEENAEVGMATTIENVVPACSWQCLQLHTPVNTGSASALYRTLPHRHPPAICCIGLSPGDGCPILWQIVSADTIPVAE